MEIRTQMWNNVGIIRTQSQLAEAIDKLSILESRLCSQESMFGLTWAQTKLRNMATVGKMIAQQAIANPVSCGAHCIQSENKTQLEINSLVESSSIESISTNGYTH